jgi:hypothetical protein
MGLEWAGDDIMASKKHNTLLVVICLVVYGII